MLTYKATDLFDLKVNGNFPLNCEFVVKTPNPSTLEKPGIYMLFFDRENIYFQVVDKEPSSYRIRNKT